MRFTERVAVAESNQANDLRNAGRRVVTDGGVDFDAPESLLVVSNRQPYRHEWTDGGVSDENGNGDDDGNGDENEDGNDPGDRDVTVDEPTGGLTAGLDPVMRAIGGTWIAWGDGSADRAVTDENDRVDVPPGSDDQYTLRRVWLSDEAVDGYYTGYSNRVLWPLCHGMTELVESRPNDLEWYRHVNRQFADAVLEEATDESVIWLQDYHLGLAPSMIRAEAPAGATVAQFWHIPWPDPSSFAACPNARELLVGLLGTDVFGFHIERYGTAFLECVQETLPSATVDFGERTVEYDGHETRIVATPMGVDASSYEERAREIGADRWDSLRERYDIPDGCAVGLGVDRLDYTKGIPERLAALERLFEGYPEWRESFTFLQKATPSRTEIPSYDRLGRQVRSTVDRINERFGTDDWQPVVYTEDFLDRADLTTLYREADLLVVSSVRDGMNLVAQEYVASSVDGDGALVLSEHAGAADALGYPAFTIDPADTDRFARTIADALGTPKSERTTRMAALRTHVSDHDLEWWMSKQFAHIEAARFPAVDRRVNDVSRSL
ncbi:alpha,alpha-trehalose-phosphate synthase (UDP-forming) [Natronosalvus halobius]|uniref:alpha,alpha-trehalose-phosphate synthase (UDP-forming) n=1 Tax=Natronosalvus halobius TaxID=2953746 RepID=UPI00209D525F|nr:trehalose-6-phosphate synthase [Natronosalvus halobius]USZ72154.1 trehalose-6-phosphate synthase [Natronosalvus halobius]